MKNTLFVSDLDGTLLQSGATLSSFAIENINNLISKGMNFSIATARSESSVKHILSALNLNLPIILMNGACIYDFKSKKYIQLNKIERESLVKILTNLNGVNGFLFTIENGELVDYYEILANPQMQEIYEDRVKKYNKRYDKVDSFFECLDKDVIYFSICDSKENLIQLYNYVNTITDLNQEFYPDIYLKDMWYLEIFSARASKYEAVKYLKDRYAFDRVVSFGDNTNDLPMFLASDVSYAVENSADEIKIKANAVCQSNFEDGVIKKILEIF